MTATRDRRSDLDGADGDVAWAERAVLGNARGWPWWGAVLLAFGLTLAGGILDQQLTDGVGTVFHSAYFVGCVAAICLVRRAALFGPMVQPPLVLGIVVPVIALGFAETPGAGLRDQLLLIGTPLINGFPAMALTTGVTVAVGVLRIYWLQKNPDAAARRGQLRERSRARAKAAAKARAAERGRDGVERGTERRPQRTEATSRGSSAKTGAPRAGGRSTAASARDRRNEPRAGGTRQGGRPVGEARPGKKEAGKKETGGAKSGPADRGRGRPESQRGGKSEGSGGARQGGERGTNNPPPRRPRGDQPPPRRRQD